MKADIFRRPPPQTMQVLSTGIFPDRLKYAVVKPILKNGGKRDVSNYRPVSLLPAFSKVLEKVIYVRMYEHWLIIVY
jgi:hypothetical protein